MSASDFIGDNNPYRSPNSAAELNRVQGLVLSVDAGWLYRKVQLGAPYHATVEWSGIGIETVTVNGQVMNWSISWWPWYVTRFDFPLRAAEEVFPASLEASISLWTSLARFALRIGEEEIYSEG